MERAIVMAILGPFLALDLYMLAYLSDPCFGSAAYSAVHSNIGPVLLGAAGLLAGDAFLPWLAVVWAAHVRLGRTLGYVPNTQVASIIFIYCHWR